MLSRIYSTIANTSEFDSAVKTFASQIQNLTESIFKNDVFREVWRESRIGSPTMLDQLFQKLDF